MMSNRMYFGNALAEPNILTEKISACSWCSSFFLTTSAERQLCNICEKEKKDKRVRFMDCPNLVNNCGFRGLSASMRDHVKTCDFATMRCAFGRCRWSGMLSKLRQHISQCHYVIPIGCFHLLRSRFTFAVLYEKSIFIVKQRVFDDTARFSVLYSGEPNKYTFSVRVGFPRSFCFGKRRVIPRMYTFRGPKIDFRNAVVLDFDLTMLEFHLRGAEVLGNTTFKVNILNAQPGALRQVEIQEL